VTAALTTPETPLAPLSRGRIHVRPAPAVDPPYDDELADGSAPGSWLTATAEQLPFEDADADRDAAVDASETRPTPRSELPCPRLMAAGLVQALLEVMSGRRSVQQLARYTTEDVYTQLDCRMKALRALRRRRGIVSTGAARLISIRVGEPSDGVAEVTAVVRRGERHRAVALRLEGADGRWRCTALQLM
jgi:hypothetical protein